MAQHKWAKEIHAWADGAEIQEIWISDDYDNPDHWNIVSHPEWDDDSKEFRVKPQPKYLYIWRDYQGGVLIHPEGLHETPANFNFVGKIEVTN